ncbi:MAG: phosphatidylglycerol lysyltransferase domain-containing protein [Elusimicrobiota bacterium]|jgi:hypothetical protein|nr:phosphatidylglycerol lysyltransferase domain-containing protein [Elusimicrobiota bacterium]
MEFRQIDINDCCLFNKYAGETINFENNFALVYIWNAIFTYEICIYENAIMARLNVDGRIVFDPPKTKDKSLDKYIYAAADYCRKNNIPLVFKILAQDYLNLRQETKDDFAVEEIRGQWDYIYLAKDLIDFPGRKFQKKRNLLSQFLRNYQYDFMDYKKERHFEQILSLQEIWAKSDDSNFELAPLKRALENLEALKLSCDIIEIDGRIAAYSVSNIHNGAGEVLFEKGETRYKGIYAAIANLTAKKRFSGIEFVNREEDMDIENLKKSKLSYNPVKQIEKYLLYFK